MFVISRTTASMALRPSSKMFLIAWCAHLGSSAAASSSPRTRRAASRAAVARSFVVDAGT
eukprot:5006365-Pleurochrysis_carterae.AAC.1